MRSLRIARFGDNMRDVAVTEGDKVEAESHFGVSVNTYSVNDLAKAVYDVSDPEIDKLVQEYEDTYAVAENCAAAANATRRCAKAPASNWACGTSWPTASARSPPTSRTSAICANCPAWPCSG